MLEVNTVVDDTDDNTRALEGLGKTGRDGISAVVEHVIGVGVITGPVGLNSDLAGHIHLQNLGKLGHFLNDVNRNHCGDETVETLLNFHTHAFELGSAVGIDMNKRRHHVNTVDTLGRSNQSLYRSGAQ